MLYKFYFLLFSSIYICSAAAQQQYLFSHLGTREGLVSNDVIAVQQDKKGFIWIATFNGLQRYDGSRFLTFKHKANDPSSIPDDKIFLMKMDKTNRLWLLCSNNQVGYFNTEDFSFHKAGVNVDEETVIKANGNLFIDDANHIILLLYGQPVLLFSEKTNIFSITDNIIQTPPRWHPVWVYQDKKNNYWIACDSGLVKCNTTAKTLSYRNHNKDNDSVIEHYAGLTHTSHPYLDKEGNFWIVSWPPNALSFYSYNIITKKEEKWAAPISKMLHNIYHEIDAIKEMKDGTLWLTGYNIFASYNIKDNSFENIQNNLPGEYSIRYDMVYLLTEDREKNMWVCTNNGLYRFNPSAQLFKTISIKRADKDTLFTPDVSDILQTRAGEILVSTWGSGIFPYDSTLKPVKLAYTDASLKAGNLFTWCNHERSNGDIWSGQQGGNLFIIHPDNHIEKIQLPVFEHSTIRQITEDEQGNLWLGTHSGLLIKWIPATNAFSLVQRLNSTIYRLYVDKQGDIWAGTQKNGLYKIKAADGSIALHYTTTGPAAARLMSVEATDIVQYNDSLYVIGSGGLNVLNSKTNSIRYMEVEVHSDYFSNTVSNIVEDRQDHLWVTTQSGLFSINMKNEIATRYNESDGLPNTYFNIGAACLLKDGRIALGTSHDFIVFNPAELSQVDFTPPDITITGFALMNEWLSMDSLNKLQHIDLPYDQNSITIAFSTLAYLNNYAIHYKLEGLDKEWKSATGNEAIYSYLPPGNYTFKIQSANSENAIGKAITTLSITINAPFWKTWWFYSLLLLAVVACLYWFDRERMKRKAAFQAIRSNISGNLHEEINNALQNINVLSEIARIKADKEPLQSRNYIDEIHHKSSSLITAMDDMLWSIDPANDTMTQTITRMQQIAHAFSYQYAIPIQMNADDKVKALKPDMKIRHESLQVYKLALQLLIEEMHAAQILVQLNYIKGYLQLNIFAPDTKLGNNSGPQKIIENLKRRASAVQAILDVQSNEKGVGITLLVKK